MQPIDNDSILNRQQLREITLDDESLMREILSALIDDTSRQIQLLGKAIRDHNPEQCIRLAHYSKGACANVGANRAAALLKQIELKAAAHDFQQCDASLGALEREVDLLRAEAVSSL